jgi:ABC-type phosphate/phosphonate transport system substrate-binding protein
MTDEPFTTDTADLSEMLGNTDTALIADISAKVDKIFAQTTWLCQMITAIQATLPPPMQQALQQAFQQMQQMGVRDGQG